MFACPEAMSPTWIENHLSLLFVSALFGLALVSIIFRPRSPSDPAVEGDYTDRPLSEGKPDV
jgi:hypothetical protein